MSADRARIAAARPFKKSCLAIARCRDRAGCLARNKSCKDETCKDDGCCNCQLWRDKQMDLTHLAFEFCFSESAVAQRDIYLHIYVKQKSVTLNPHSQSQIEILFSAVNH